MTDERAADLPSAVPEAGPEMAAPVMLAPVGESERIQSLDVLRGFGVLGILVLNIQSFSMIGAAYLNPNAYGNLEGANGWVWYLSNILGDQKFMSIFSMLFGAGVALMTSRAEAKGRSALGLHYRRMGWLILFGLLHAHLLWYGDILYFYGMCGLVIYPLRRLPVWALILLGVLALAFGSGVNLLWQWTLQFWPDEAIEGLAQGWVPSTEVVQQELDAYRGGWLAQAFKRTPMALFLETILLVVGGIGAKTGGLMLIGMALYKRGIVTAERSRRFYGVMAVVCLAIGLAVVQFGYLQHEAHDWDITYSFYGGMQFNYWASVVVALGYIALIMSVCKAGILTMVTRTLAAVGRMALTNYLVQTIICTTIFYGHGLGLFGSVERSGQIGIVVAIWALQLVYSPIWLRFFRYGPFEWLWRTLSYWRVQPIRAAR